MTVAFVVTVLVWGFVVGGLARFAVPGPDPMPAWVTVAIGIAGSILGGLVAKALIGNTGGLLFSLAGSVVLVVGYRRLVRRRPLTGPGTQLPPR